MAPLEINLKVEKVRREIVVCEETLFMRLGSKSQKFIRNINQTLESIKVLSRNSNWRRNHARTEYFYCKNQVKSIRELQMIYDISAHFITKLKSKNGSDWRHI